MDRQPDAGQSFAEIARREGKAERHIRHLAPLAFPREARFVLATLVGFHCCPRSDGALGCVGAVQTLLHLLGC